MYMDIWEINKLILFIAFVVPGFISTKVYELVYPASHKDASKIVIDAITFSSVNYALIFWAIYYVEIYDLRSIFPFLYFVFYIFVLFIAPIIWSVIWRSLRTSQWFQANA